MIPSDFLDLARTLTAKDGAARCRTGISRAYYAAYHSALELCEERLEVRVLGKSEKHSNTSLCLRHSGDDAARIIAKLLDDLYQKRVWADYRLDRTDVESAKTARYYVDMAERALRELHQLTDEPDRLGNMRAAMLDARALKGKVAALGTG